MRKQRKEFSPYSPERLKKEQNNKEADKLIEAARVAGERALLVPGSQIDIKFESLFELNCVEGLLTSTFHKIADLVDDRLLAVMPLKESINAFYRLAAEDNAKLPELMSKFELVNGSIIQLIPEREALIKLLDTMKFTIEQHRKGAEQHAQAQKPSNT